jgi:uncharacterized OB-fold protein
MTEPEAAPIPVLVCAACGQRRLTDEHDPFRPPGVRICARCLGTELTATTIAGEGTVRTFSWYLEPPEPAALDVPYNVALVELDGGPLVIAGVEGVAVEELAIGRRVRAVVRRREGADVLRFV